MIAPSLAKRIVKLGDSGFQDSTLEHYIHVEKENSWFPKYVSASNKNSLNQKPNKLSFSPILFLTIKSQISPSYAHHIQT